MTSEETKLKAAQSLENQTTDKFSDEADSTRVASQKMVNPLEVPQEEPERYQILKTLGEGGMGLVQLAHDSLLQREVALKTIKMEPIAVDLLNEKQEMLLWRLKKEAEITALLEHPNIVPLYDLQKKKNGEFYFTMRKIKGETLARLLNQKKQGENTLDQEDILTIFIKVCDAIAYAHSIGVIHRDLKPDNVMVGEFGEVYVMDWGIAKRIRSLNLSAPLQEPSILEQRNTLNKVQEEEQTKAREVFKKAKNEFKTLGGIGTFGYMAPEQSKNSEELKEQADIYALGKILKQCYTYKSPAQEFREILTQNLNLTKKQKDIPLTPNSSSQTIPEDIKAIVKKATQENWRERYGSVKEFCADIERYRKNLRVSVRNYKLSQLVWKWVKRNQIAVTMFSIVFAIFISFWGYLKYQEQQEFETNLTQARIEQANGVATENRDEKMDHWLKGLYAVDTALLMAPKHSDVAKMKYELSQSLIQSACETRDFQFASYFVRGVERLETLDLQKKESLKEKVESAKTQSLREHQKRLNHWMTVLKDPKPGMRDEALLEISKMEEPEILDALSQEVQAGTAYFIKNLERNSKSSEYYEIMVLALASLENPKAGPILWESLELMSEQVLRFKEGSRPDADVQYMVNLAQALSTSKSIGFSEKLRFLRLKMGETSLFSQQTLRSFKKLALLENLLSKHQGTSFQDLLDRGLLKSEIDDHEGAILDFSEAIRLNPLLAKAYNRRGGSKFKKGDIEGAILDFTEAIRLNPQFSEFYTDRGAAKEDKNDLNGALEDHTKAIGLNPRLSEAYTNRGTVRHWKGDTNGAIEDFSEAIRLNPQDAIAFKNRGIMKHTQGDFEGALLDFSEAIRLNPQEAQGYLNRGTTKYIKRDLETALLDFNEAIRLAPQSKEAYANRGAAKRDKEDLQGAIADYNQALRLDPKDAVIYYNRGIAKKAKGDLDGAIWDYTEALLLNPQFAEAHYNQGFAKRDKGDRKGAIASFEAGFKVKMVPDKIPYLIDLLKQQSREDFSQKEWASAKSSMLKLKQYLPPDDPQQKQLDQKLHQLETLLQPKDPK